MIPKIVHCCWFGGPKTKLAEKCRASWTKFAPEFRVEEWTLEKISLEAPKFVREAMAQHKWAFVADWVRFAALYLEGGVYFDYDFELVGTMDGLLAGGEFVNTHWLTNGSVGIEASVMALEKGSPIAKAMLDYYSTANFDANTTVGERLDDILPKAGLSIRTVPPEVLSPYDTRGVCHRTDATIGIHHYAMSWAPNGRRIAKWLSWHGMQPLVNLLLSAKRCLH